MMPSKAFLLSAYRSQNPIARTLALFDEIYAMVRRKVVAEAGAMEERELRRRVAQCLYRTEPAVQAMLASCGPCTNPSSR